MSVPNSTEIGPRGHSPKLPFINRFTKFTTILIVILLAITASCAITSRSISKDMKQRITGTTPNGFPVLVFWFQDGATNLQAKVIPFEELDSHRKDHPNIFFTLPEGGGQILHNCLRQQAEMIDADIRKQYSTGRVMQITARIESSDQTHQSWRVRFQHGNDHVNIGYYTASKNTFKPTYIERYFGPALAMQSLPYDFAWLAVVWTIAGIGIYLLTRIRYFNASKWAAHAA